MPSTTTEWTTVSDDFYQRWNFPNCVGALDGKHVVIVKPGKSGSTFMNYKHTFSVVLMALVDAKYRFRYINVGAQGRISDAGVFSECRLSRALASQQLNLPEPTQLPGSTTIAPYMFLADEAFPLKLNLIKPFSRRGLVLSERIFNYRLSRARRVVENAFGLLSGKFRVFRAPIPLKTATVRSLVKATICLHNFLIDRNAIDVDCERVVDREDLQQGILVPGDWRDNPHEALQSIKSQTGRIPTDAKMLRLQLSEYFLNEGAVEWQSRFI